MTTARLSGRFRRLVGNPTAQEAPDREITEFISRALTFLADYLKFVVVTETTVPLVANQMEYPLPKNLLYFVFVELGGLLTPTSTWAINSGQRTTQSTPVGPDWRTAVPSKPLLYAVEGRELILNPPPDAGTAATFPTMVWRYIGTGTEWAEQSEIGMGQAGIPSISDADEDLVTYEAAIQWCAAHPSEQNKARLDEYRIEVGRRLPAAKRRWENMIRDYAPTWRPDTSGRMYSARAFTPVDKVKRLRYSQFRGEYQGCDHQIGSGFPLEYERPSLARVGIG